MPRPPLVDGPDSVVSDAAVVVGGVVTVGGVRGSVIVVAAAGAR